MDQENKWPNGMPPMDIKRYMEKNPHLKPIDEQSHHSVNRNATTLSDIQNLVQASASKNKQLDNIMSQEGDIDDSKFEEFSKLT